MTKRDAKELTIQVWTELAANPSYSSKVDVSDELYEQIRYCAHMCPLCDMYYDTQDKKTGECVECPLKSCVGPDAPYDRWCKAYWYSDVEDRRKQAAEEIVALVKAWEI